MSTPISGMRHALPPLVPPQYEDKEEEGSPPMSISRTTRLTQQAFYDTLKGSECNYRSPSKERGEKSGKYKEGL